MSSPIDRIKSRNEAFDTLGLSLTATRSDLKQAFRKLAFSKHPDRNPEAGQEFSRITEAYKYICDHADEIGIKDAPEPANDPEPVTGAVSPRRVSRPALKATEQEFDAKSQADCEALLIESEEDSNGHIPSAVYRMGRNLTYYVPTPLLKGRNAVALPTGMLTDARKTLPKLIAFDFRDAPGGFFEVPAEACERHFPGARQIRIRFASV